MVNLLIAHDADLEARDAEGMAAIHYAAEGGHIGIVESFLSKKVHVDYTGKSEMTPLMIACSTGKTEMAKLLVRRKANTRHKSDHGMTALHWACFHGQRDIVELLVQRKVTIDAQTSDGRTPLQIAILSKSFDTVEYLLRNKASIEASCAQAWRPIHYACKVADGKIVDLLLSRKANVESSNNAGQRSLHVATIQGSLDIVRKLLDKNASIDCLDKTGERPLTLAVLHGHLDIMQALLSRGAALRLKFKQGQSHEDSPICIAAREGHYEIVLELIKKGASVRQTDERGWQPLRYAAHYGHPEITEALLQHGASVAALNLGAHGFSTSARIGFAHGVPDDRRSQIMEILETAEAIERSQQEIAERTQYPVRNGLVEIDSSATSERANIPPLPSPQWTPTVLQSERVSPSQPLLGTQYSQWREPFPRHNVSHIAAVSPRMSSPASVESDFSTAAASRPSSEAYQQSQSIPPRRAQTTRPRSNLSGIHSVDDVYGDTTSAPTSFSRSISAATPRAAPPVRAPPPPPLQQRIQTPPPAYLSPALPIPQTDSALPQEAEISIEERLQVLRLTCAQCIRAGRQAPDFSCVSCRSNVFRHDHNSQQTASVVAASHSNEDEEESRMQHTSGPVYEMYVPGVLKN
jgi:ankyrin repeat protein